MSRLKVLVTGTTGFLGSHAVGEVLAAGHSVRALVRKGKRPPAAAAEPAEGDVTDPASIERAVAGIDVVIHVAGLIKARSEAEFAAVNVAGARNVAVVAARAGVRRLVLVSSLAARGPRDAGSPVSAYGRSKLLGERATLESAGGMEVLVLRPTAVYGPRDRALLPFFQAAARGIRPVFAGGGSLTFVYGPDVAAALARLVDAKVAPGSVLEVSDGRDYSWPEVVAEVAHAVGRPGRHFAVPRLLVEAAALGVDVMGRLSGTAQVFGRHKLPEMYGSWPADPRELWAATGIAPTGLSEGMARTAEAYRDAGWL